MDPPYFGNLDPHPDPDPHQSDKLDPEPDPHQFADNKPKCMEYEPICALFKGLSLYLKDRIWIRIRIRVKMGPGSHQSDNSNPNPHPIPNQSDADPQHGYLYRIGERYLG
jgi:hypothetical protein